MYGVCVFLYCNTRTAIGFLQHNGSFTNGMIYEALNNCCEKDLKFIVILNDNEMSISSNGE